MNRAATIFRSILISIAARYSVQKSTINRSRLFKLRYYPILLATICAMGCSHASMPSRYANTPIADAVAILQQRASAIRTLSAQGSIILTRPGGNSIHLEGALAAHFPGELHLRAWKFNHTAFDLVLTPAGLWLYAPDDPHVREQLQSAKSGTIQFARAWMLLSHDFFLASDLSIRAAGRDLLLTHENSSGKIICRVDRATLTPREYTLFDPQGHKQLVMRLDQYNKHDGIEYPERIIAESQFGRVEIRLRQIRINQPLSPSAFLPSPRAERMP